MTELPVKLWDMFQVVKFEFIERTSEYEIKYHDTFDFVVT